MDELQKTDYELVHMSDAARQELIEAERYAANEQFTDFNKKLFEKIQSYIGDTPNDIKMILALNQLLQREFNQHEAYSLAGFEQALLGVRDVTLLANNNFVYGDNNIATESAVYLVIEPEIVNPEEGEKHISNSEKIKRATEIFELEGIEYNLYLFLNTDTYDIYEALEEDLRSSVNKDFQIISLFPNLEMRSEAEVTVDLYPDSSVNTMVNSFLTAFSLFSHRRKKVFFNYSAEKKGEAFGSLDFLLLAHSYLNNLLINPTMVQPLAKHFTSLWLGTNSTFKYRYEEIEDFFYCPSVVLVKGLSPVYGIIVGRKVRIKGAIIDASTGEETLIDFEINTEADIAGLYHEEELSTYLKLNPNNLRNKLIRWKDNVVRVESVEKTLHIRGKNLNNPSAPLTAYTLEGDLSALTFLTPFYRKKYYLGLLKLPDTVSYRLPERFKTYLLRLASYRGLDVPEVDTKWFSKTNRSLTDVLSMLDEKFHLDNILGHGITSVDGIVNKEVLVSLEGMKCLTREK